MKAHTKINVGNDQTPDEINKLIQKFKKAIEVFTQEVNIIEAAQKKYYDSAVLFSQHWNNLKFDESVKVLLNVIKPAWEDLINTQVPIQDTLAAVVNEIAIFPNVNSFISTNDLAMISMTATSLSERRKRILKTNVDINSNFTLMVDNVKTVKVGINEHLIKLINDSLPKSNIQPSAPSEEAVMGKPVSKIDTRMKDVASKTEVGSHTPPSRSSDSEEHSSDSDNDKHASSKKAAAASVVKAPASPKATPANIGLHAVKPKPVVNLVATPQKKNCCIL